MQLYNMPSRIILINIDFKFITLWHTVKTGLKVIKLGYSLRLKIKRNDWLLADNYLQAELSASSQSLSFILSLRINSNFITSRPGPCDDV